ncbi:hypothetical protein F2P79_025468 [Pimephales promelas]|nr:hypothetical protein F2P79_025468 [Pimephales promelas]
MRVGVGFLSPEHVQRFRVSGGDQTQQILLIFIMADSQASRDGDFSPGHSSVQQKSSNPESSCVSVKSDRSMDHPLAFKSGDKRPDLSYFD